MRYSPILAVLTLALITAPILAAMPLPNAWQITDNSSDSGSLLHYTTNLSGAQQIAATNTAGGWRLSVTARFVTDFADTKTMVVGYGLGNKRFLIWFEINANGDLTAELEGDVTYTVTTNGTGTMLYHRHEIVYDAIEKAAMYFVDGVRVGCCWSASPIALPAGQVFWGAGSSAGRGQMNFHSVEFFITNRLVGTYEAGTADDPVRAPDSPTWGWTRTPSQLLTNTAATNISPDTAPLPSVNTLPADQFMPDSAQVNAEANPKGSFGSGWFEWGVTTNYGNATLPQPIGSGLMMAGFSNVINGLVIGTDYHFRAVASNAFGLAPGLDRILNLTAQRPIVAVSAPNTEQLFGIQLNGSVNPRGFPTIAWFEWGANTTYGNITAVQDAGAGTSSRNLPALVNAGAGTTYDYRIVASNLFGLAFSANQTFTPPGKMNIITSPITGVSWSSVAWADYDRDGRLDILLTGLPDTGNAVSQLWRNTGSAFVNVTTTVAPGLPGLYPSTVAWCDYDNDGQIDFLAGPQIWRNVGGTFINVTATVAPGLPAPDQNSAAWGDYDNDGLQDLLITGNNLSRIYHNTGTNFVNVTTTVAPGLPGVAEGSVAWGDYNNDGRLDFLLTGSPFVSQIWSNTGVRFVNVTATAAPGLPGVHYSSIDWGDFDGDGRLDFMLTGFSSGGRISLIRRNNGTNFVEVSNRVGSPWYGISEGAVAWGDYDSDGRLDIALSGTATVINSPSPILKLYRNEDGRFFETDSLTSQGVEHGSAAWADYNRDGRPDILFSGFTTGGRKLYLVRNQAPVTNAPPAVPQNLRATTLGSETILSWNAASDDHTPSAGLTYNVRIGSTPGASDIMSPMAMADGTRLLATMGNAQLGTNHLFRGLLNRTYYWSVQAIDGAFAGSAFAPEQQFTISEPGPPVIFAPIILGDADFQFAFSNSSIATYEVLRTTNLAAPIGDWQLLGLPVPIGGSLFKFTDPLTPNQSQSFYLLRKQ